MESRTALHPSNWWLLLAATTVVIRLLSEGMLEPADGVWHYQIARWSWTHPHLLLDHWGKPLFTLLASPFAQLGHWGMSLFNALCFVATCWAADGILRRAGTVARWGYPPALLLVPVYGTMVLAGMTEVFFGLLTVLVLRALVEERFLLAAMIASFMPFARPEYVVVLPLVGIWLIVQRQWRILPWLLTGHLIFALAGAIMLGDALWYFHSDPYTGAADLYGHGDLLHFWHVRSRIFGTPLLVLLLVALFASLYLAMRKGQERPMLRSLLVMALLPALGILLVHAVLWWQGLKGSLGLERVLATAAPLLVLFAVWAPARLLATRAGSGLASRTGAVLIATAYIGAAAHTFLSRERVPVPANNEIAFLDRVAENLSMIPRPEGRYVIFHPYITYSLGLNPFDTTKSFAKWPGAGFRPQDRLVWDGRFGPNEAHLPVEELLGDSTLRLNALYVPKEHMSVLGGHPMEVFVFERGKGVRWQMTDTLYKDGWPLEEPDRSEQVPCGTEGLCISAAEFPFSIENLPVEAPGMCFAELIIQGTVQWLEGEGEVQFVFSEDGPEGQRGYRSFHLSEGPFQQRYRLPPRPPAHTNKLYLWNLSGKPFQLRGLEVMVQRTFQQDP